MQEKYMRHDTNERIQSHRKSDLDLGSKIYKSTNKKIIKVIFNGYSTMKTEFEAEAGNISPSTMIFISNCFGINRGHSTFIQSASEINDESVAVESTLLLEHSLHIIWNIFDEIISILDSILPEDTFAPGDKLSTTIIYRVQYNEKTLIIVQQCSSFTEKGITMMKDCKTNDRTLQRITVKSIFYTKCVKAKNIGELYFHMMHYPLWELLWNMIMTLHLYCKRLFGNNLNKKQTTMMKILNFLSE